MSAGEVLNLQWERELDCESECGVRTFMLKPVLKLVDVQTQEDIEQYIGTAW